MKGSVCFLLPVSSKFNPARQGKSKFLSKALCKKWIKLLSLFAVKTCVFLGIVMIIC